MICLANVAVVCMAMFGEMMIARDVGGGAAGCRDGDAGGVGWAGRQ